MGIPEDDQGDPPCLHATPRRVRGWAAPWHGAGPTWTFTKGDSSPSFLSLDQTLHHCSNSCSCSKFFDLLSQPIFAADIWIICSLVCDSFDYPSRILFSCVYLEYFGTVGDMLCELACLFYV